MRYLAIVVPKFHAREGLGPRDTAGFGKGPKPSVNDGPSFLERFILPAAREMSFSIPVGLPRVKSWRTNIRIFRFHAEVQDVPLDGIFECLRKIVFSSDSLDFPLHEGHCDLLEFDDDFVPIAEAILGSTKQL